MTRDRDYCVYCAVVTTPARKAMDFEQCLSACVRMASAIGEAIEISTDAPDEFTVCCRRSGKRPTAEVSGFDLDTSLTQLHVKLVDILSREEQSIEPPVFVGPDLGGQG